MKEFRSNIRSEHDRYAECEHHLALEESQLRLQMIQNENLQSRIAISENRVSEESLAEVRRHAGHEDNGDYVLNYT